MLRPMISYFGSKWRIASHYPPPRYDTIIEPFSGSAGYSLWYPHKNVILIEKNESVSALWKYLIKVKSSEIRNLPLVKHNETVDDLNISEEARILIGFWINSGTTGPRKTPCSWMTAGTHETCFWGISIRERIARQVERIRHWKIVHGDYTDAPDIEATWFIDPPYQLLGKFYRHGAREIDFSGLAEWCKNRHGDAIVCEVVGADWLPFVPFRNAAATKGKYRKGTSREAVWYSNPPLTLFNCT